MQTLNDVYVKCNEMMNTFAQLLPTAFFTTNYEAPPTHTFDMPIAHEFQQQYESQTQTQTHPQAYTQIPTPQQQSFHYEGFGGMSDYSIHHQFGSSSQYQGTLPSYNAFGTSSTTPLSAFNSQQYYQPTMSSQVQQGNFLDDEDDEDDDNEDEEEEDEEVPQMVRGGSGQPRQSQQQQQLRVQPPRRRKPHSCGTSSHRRH
ncbi:hypothetical protein Lal_00032523 [Lupinus albus]|nr:hypothetical protein Lal_00032523 [Lupinus albus]